MKILLDVIGQQHTMPLQIIHPDDIPWAFCNALKCQILVPAEYWCPYGTLSIFTCFPIFLGIKRLEVSAQLAVALKEGEPLAALEDPVLLGG